MAQHDLDARHAVRPTLAFARALTVPLDAEKYSFLLAHADELALEHVIALFRAELPDDVQVREAPFVRRLADLVVASDHELLQLLEARDAFDDVVWLELTKLVRDGWPTQPFKWYRLVDKVRGCALFNALNVPPPYREEFIITSHEEARPEPMVVPILDDRHNEPIVRAFALTLPLDVILDLHTKLPDVVTKEDVASVVTGRVDGGDAPWHPPFPEWTVDHVRARLRSCGTDEALALFAWLESQPGAGDLFELAFGRFKLDPFPKEWHRALGTRLRTGTAWKSEGRRVIAFCVELNKGFPPLILEAAGVTDASEEAAGRLRRVHDAAASVFVDRAAEAVRAGDIDLAKRCLAALTCLDPGSFIAGQLHHLSKQEPMPKDLGAMIEMCAELFRRPTKRTPTVDAFLTAFDELRGGGQ